MLLKARQNALRSREVVPKTSVNTASMRETPAQAQVKSFLKHLISLRNASQHTVLAYEKDLYKFCEFAGKGLEWRRVDHRKIREFLAQLMGNGLSKPSVARALASLRSFYKWMAREGLVESNPAALVSTPKLPRILPRVPTMEEVNGLLDANLPEQAAFPERDRVIFELLYGCGLRNSELIGIQLDDISWSNE